MLNVALMQYSISSSRVENYEKIRSYLASIDKSEIDYLLLPELFSTPYFCQRQDSNHFQLAQTLDGSDIEFLKQLCLEYNIYISTSFFEKRLDGLFANTAVTLDPKGQVVSLYRKSHIPQDPCFEEKYYFQPGPSLPEVSKIESLSVSTAICWDQWFPEIARVQALEGVNLLNYPTAIAWLEGEEEDFELQRDSWLTVTRSHAIANGIFVSCINRVGCEGKLLFWGSSHLTAPNGKALIEFEAAEQGIKVCAIDKDLIGQTRTAWPFLRDRRPSLYGKITEQK